MPATVFWNVDADGFWDVPTNWRDDQGNPRLPGSDDDVVLDRPGRDYTITHRANTTTIRGLTSQEGLIVAVGSTLALAGASELSGSLTLQNAGRSKMSISPARCAVRTRSSVTSPG